MQQILAKSDLYIISSTSSASIGSSGINAHGINQTFNPPLMENCNNSIANCFAHTIHSQALVYREAAPLVNHNYKPTNSGRHSTLARAVISGNILPPQSRGTEEAFLDWAVGLRNLSLAFLIDPVDIQATDFVSKTSCSFSQNKCRSMVTAIGLIKCST